MNEKIRLSRTVEQGGCSAKLGPKDLERVLSKTPLPTHPNIVVGAETHDDAGVFRLPDGSYMIQTTDFFPPMVDDPFDFGQVAAANALSDVYAMGGRPITALSLVMWPSKSLPLESLPDMLGGAISKVEEAGAVILGGHTIDDEPVKFGLAVTGLVEPEKLVTNSGARPGQKLVLSKPLGTAILTGAFKVELIDEAEVRPAIRSMTTLNDKAALRMTEFGVKGGTDVTGFGLLGHAYRMANASAVTFRIESAALPELPRARELIEMGVIPGGCMRNLDFVRDHIAFLPSLLSVNKWLALDPQTSGGLLMAVDAERADALVAALHADGLTDATVIGEVHPPGEKRILLA